ncbi:MAG TPA: hypothetical protein EYQ84_11330 [Nitrospinaceae bacterium]|nr:hypothetical protein [Nitrospinaceae bacterium]
MFLLSVNSNAQLNEIIPQNCISQKHDHSKHTCGKKRLPEEPVWVDPPEKSGPKNKNIMKPKISFFVEENLFNTSFLFFLT